jgi:hypothetical protein
MSHASTADKKPKVRERDVQKLILDYLKWHRIFHWRQNVGSMAGKYKGKDWFVRFGYRGMPDIFLMRLVANVWNVNHAVPQIIGIEVKAPNGEQSQMQREFQTEFEKAGGIYILARSLEDVTKRLHET